MRRIIVGALLAGFGAGCGVGSGDAARRSPGAGDSAPAAAAPADERPVLLCFGTSLTAGLGLAPESAYPALLQLKIDSAGFAFRVVNAGVSGETSAAGLRRIDWLLQQPQRVAVLVLELGANDALRGLPLQMTQANLSAMAQAARTAGARVVIAGMRVPPNYGREYGEAFAALFAKVARSEHAALVPFLLKGVADAPQATALFQADRIHPREEAHPTMLANVWQVLKPLLR